MPNLPMDLNELNVMLKNMNHSLIINRNENCLIENDKISNILLFSTESNLKLLKKRNKNIFSLPVVPMYLMILLIIQSLQENRIKNVYHLLRN